MTLRRMPEWIGPAAYLVTLAALGLAAGSLMQSSPSKASAGADIAAAQSKAVASQRRVRPAPDNPDTAPELSPVYPTASYPPSVTNFREEALRKIKSASMDRPKKRRLVKTDPSIETTGYGYRDAQAMRRPDMAW
jgi:hypothetical protein